jgi:hypothetical protein
VGRLPTEIGGGPTAPDMVQARVTKTRDSRVTEAKEILQGPWSIVTRALFLSHSLTSTERR